MTFTEADNTDGKISIEELQDYIAMIGHQLRSPLTNIRFVHQTILENNSENLTEEQRHLLIQAQKRSDRMNELTKDLIATGKHLQLMKTTFELQPLEPLLSEMVDQVRVMAHHKNLTIVQEYAKNARPIHFDREQISDAIFNLLDNAISYTENGGNILVRTTYSDDGVTIMIADTGVGISSENVSKLFEKFSRFHNQSISGVEGSGLGLYVAQKNINIHGGSIEYRPNQPKGSQFIVLFLLLINNLYGRSITNRANN